MYGDPEFKHASPDSGYRGARRDRDEDVMRNLERDWSRHPELRAQHGGSFERYVRSAKHNVTFG